MIQAIILAAGKGTRMNKGRPSAVPKVLFPLAGQPIVAYIIETLGKIGIKKPVLVIGYKGEMVIEEFGQQCQYVWQRQRLGTGQAAKLGVQSIGSNFPDVLILNGDDSAFYQAETLQKIIAKHRREKATLTVLTARIAHLTDIGRVLRNRQGQITGVVEKEDMTSEQAKLDEINCATYLINLAWLKKNISKIKKHYKAGKEYPLPDIIKIALAQKKKVLGITINASEWLGINTPEQYKKAEEEIKKRPK